MISHFFIDRPIFAAVLSILITLTGGIALRSLPIAQYPEITPPSVQVSIIYPGASAQVVADTVAAPVEQQVNGVEGMMYMTSQSGNDGSYSLTVTFDIGTNLNTALVMVQNRVALAMPQLPTAVQLQGISIRKKTPDIVLLVTLVSPDDRYDRLYLSNFAMINLRDELLRLEGVSDINIFGERDYSIRVWLSPQQLASRSMTAVDVANAIRTQNLAVALGQLGQPPTAGESAYQFPLDTLGRLSEPEQFEDIIVKVYNGTGTPTAAAGAPPAQGGGLPPASALPGTPTPGSPSTIPDLTGGQLTAGTPLSTATGNMSVAATSPTNTTTGIGTSGSIVTGTGTTGRGTPGGGNATGTTATGSGPTVGPGSTSGGVSPGTVGSGSTGGGQDNSGVQAMPTAGGRVPAGGTVGGTGMAGGGLSAGPPSVSFGLVRLRDVARVELGAQNYNSGATFDGKPAVSLAVHQLPGTNALDVGDRVRARMAELKDRFPDGIEYTIAYDTTPYIRESVMDVVWTLLEAVGLVAAVVLLFLQSWRAALIPLVAVPVAIIGTFAVMAALGFSLNNISLFGLVLAIGIVVDDAIVVVENVERWLEQGYAARDAARKAMDEVTGPVIAVALVLCAVFVPCAFIGGITGQFFRQFAVTISVSTVFSAMNSLTLSPALAAILLRPHGARRDPFGWLLHLLLGWPFRGFNAVFGFGTSAYTRVVGWLLRGNLAVLAVYGGLLALTYLVFLRAPTGFVPEQDQGRLIVGIQLPDSASLPRTEEVIAQVERIALATPGVAHTATAAGMSLVMSANSSNFGTAFIILDPFEERRTPDLSADAIMARLRRECARQVKDALITVFNAPPIPGLSVASGFRLMVEDRTGLGTTVLQQQADALVAKLRRERGLAGVFEQLRSNTPQLFLERDKTKIQALGVAPNDVTEAMEIYLGSLYANSFNKFGRYWQVTLQAEGRYRSRVSDVNLIQVRNQSGGMVPLGTLATVREVNGPVMVQRYNLYKAAPIAGNIVPGFSSGEAIATIDRVADQSLPRTMGTEWTELMFLQIRAGNTAFYVFLLAVVFVFLALAALYESWALPLAVILVVPLCLLCSLGGVLYSHRAVDIFVQIGLVVLVGLACKNSILIVEFAAHLHRQGRPRYEATVEASRLRLRPILMTSLAFILGVLPLAIATGAGAEMRRSLGTAVFTGMIGVTVFGIFLTPVFFYVVQWLGETRLFLAAGTNWVGSAVVCGVLGLVVGFALSELHIGRLSWNLALGLVAGVAVGLAAQAVWRRVWRRRDRAMTG
jgi:multidrug efflux pump